MSHLHFFMSVFAALALMFAPSPTNAQDSDNQSRSPQRENQILRNRDEDQQSRNDDRRFRQSDRDSQSQRDPQRDPQRDRQRRLSLDEDDAAIGVTVSSERRQDGAVVEYVHPNSPASDAGLRSGDRIMRVDGQRIQSAHDLVREVHRMEPGKDIELRFERSGNVRTIDIKLDTREDALVRGRASGQDRGYSDNGNWNERSEFGDNNRRLQSDRDSQRRMWQDRSSNYGDSRQWSNDSNRNSGQYSRDGYEMQDRSRSQGQYQTGRQEFDRSGSSNSNSNMSQQLAQLERQVRELSRELTDLRQTVRDGSNNRTATRSYDNRDYNNSSQDESGDRSSNSDENR